MEKEKGRDPEGMGKKEERKERGRQKGCVWVPRVCVLSSFSCVQLFSTLWTVVCQAPLSMGFSRQNYQGGLPCLPSGDLSYREINPFLTSSALADRFCTTSATCGYKRRRNSYLRKNSMSFDRNVTILFLSGTQNSRGEVKQVDKDQIVKGLVCYAHCLDLASQ